MELTDEQERQIWNCEKKHCRPACYEESYDITKEEGKNNDHLYCYGYAKNYLFRKKVYVTILFNDMETTTFTSRPIFESIEVFSYLGGYLGIWLGISLIAVFDFFETVVFLIRFPIRKKKEAKERMLRKAQMNNAIRRF